jgi:hypothetical protein
MEEDKKKEYHDFLLSSNLVSSPPPLLSRTSKTYRRFMEKRKAKKEGRGRRAIVAVSVSGWGKGGRGGLEPKKDDSKKFEGLF